MDVQWPALHMCPLDPDVSALLALQKWDNVTQAQDEAVLTTSDNGTRIYWLNREKKHHALDQEMIDILERSIDDWSDSKLAKILIGRGKGGKAFCAGGDIKRPSAISLVCLLFCRLTGESVPQRSRRWRQVRQPEGTRWPSSRRSSR